MELDKIQSKILKDSLVDDWNVMIIKGIAGSGKTTLLSEIYKKHSISKSTFKIKPGAFTGRASAVLRDKALINSQTIHYWLFGRSKMYTEFDRFLEPTIMKDPREQEDSELWIIDEASMIEEYLLFWLLVHIHIPDKKDDFYSRDSEGNIIKNKDDSDRKLSFMSAKLHMLLNDPNVEFKIQNNKKIIFCGDINQLSPMYTKGYKKHALLSTSLKLFNFKIKEYELEKMHRHKDSTDIQKIAYDIENNPENIDESKYSSDNVKIVRDNSFQNICNLFLKHKNNLENAKYIVYNNQTAHEFNILIRPLIFPEAKLATKLIKGDYIHVTKNNYHYSLWNGDFLKVLNILDNKTGPKIHVKAISDLNDKKLKVDKEVFLEFTKVEVEQIDTNVKHKLWIITDTLSNSSKDEDRWIYSDRDEMYFIYEEYLNNFFEYRKPKKDDASYQEYKFEKESDEFNNALFVNYSYAITGHKSQGGEWDTVFLDLTCIKKEDENNIKFKVFNGYTHPEGWRYTAGTRANKLLYVIPRRDTLLLK